MKSSISGTSIVEALVSMVIIIIGITGVYNIYDKSEKLALSTENRIKAIGIAREGIEVLENIRDTNWLLFGSDTKNCWNTFNYDPSCLGNTTNTYRIGTGNYIIYKDNNRWKLQTGTLLGNYNSGTYRNNYEIKFDNNGLFTQSGGTSTLSGFLFTRHINISYIDTNGGTPEPTDEKMLIKSVVSWKDNSKDSFHTVELENILTNWKRN